jgi:hypothetical protein
MRLYCASHWCEWHLVIIEWSTQVRVSRYSWCSIGCFNKLSVISVCGRRRSHNEGGKSSAMLANALKKWALKFQMVTSAAFLRWQPGGTSSIAILCLLVVKDVFLWDYPGSLQACHQHPICPVEFVAVSASDGFDQDCIAVHLDHDHDVFIATLGSHGKPACLVGEHSFAYIIPT